VKSVFSSAPAIAEQLAIKLSLIEIVDFQNDPVECWAPFRFLSLEIRIKII
jgi:hypothetical protein